MSFKNTMATSTSQQELSPGRFDDDFDYVRRPRKRRKSKAESKQQKHQDDQKMKLTQLKSRQNGLNLLKRKKNKKWKPKFIPGVSATPSRDPILNTPRDVVKAEPPKVYEFPADGRPRSPHQYSSTYFVDTYALRQNNSMKKQQFLENQAKLLSGNTNL